MIFDILSCLVSFVTDHWFVSLILGTPLFVKLYLVATTAKCTSKKILDGKTAIVTGANTGIGLETARDFAHRGARVILACRSIERANKAKDDIIYTTGNNNIEVRIVDLSSMESVRNFCKEILRTEKRLDILVNNAAMNTAALDVKQSRMLTVDKLEVHMAANHFGPFLLTHLLLGLMMKTPGSRIVIVSSLVHSLVDIDVDNLNSEKSYVPLMIYSVTKLANILFTVELAGRIKDSGVTCNTLHPGMIDTEIYRNYPKFVMPFVRFFSKTAMDGAQTTIHVAVSEELDNVTGKYFVECKEAQTSAGARDMVKARKLWDKCVELTGLKKQEMFC